MNREIKFRGKTELGDWVFGDLITNSPEHPTIIFDGKLYWKVIPESVGQFTGLPDKNGKEIWEGDAWKDRTGRAWIIKHLNQFSRFAPTDSNGFIGSWNEESAKNGEVIGNIHDNPDKLNNGAGDTEK